MSAGLQRVGVCSLFAILATAPAALAQDTHLLIVAGLGGEPGYAESFREWSSRLEASAEKRMGIPRDHVIYLTESNTNPWGSLPSYLDTLYDVLR